MRLGAADSLSAREVGIHIIQGDILPIVLQRTKIIIKQNQLAKRLTIFLNLWYLGHVNTPIFLAFRMGKKKERKAPNFNGCNMCLTNIVFIKYCLVCKVRIFSNKMYILFSRNDII
jgi:hypothetical protein